MTSSLGQAGWRGWLVVIVVCSKVTWDITGKRKKGSTARARVGHPQESGDDCGRATNQTNQPTQPASRGSLLSWGMLHVDLLTRDAAGPDRGCIQDVQLKLFDCNPQSCQTAAPPPATTAECKIQMSKKSSSQRSSSVTCYYGGEVHFMRLFSSQRANCLRPRSIALVSRMASTAPAV